MCGQKADEGSDVWPCALPVTPAAAWGNTGAASPAPPSGSPPAGWPPCPVARPRSCRPEGRGRGGAQVGRSGSEAAHAPPQDAPAAAGRQYQRRQQQRLPHPTQCSGGTPISSAARRKVSGWGLPLPGVMQSLQGKARREAADASPPFWRLQLAPAPESQHCHCSGRAIFPPPLRVSRSHDSVEEPSGQRLAVGPQLQQPRCRERLVDLPMGRARLGRERSDGWLLGQHGRVGAQLAATAPRGAQWRACCLLPPVATAMGSPRDLAARASSSTNSTWHREESESPEQHVAAIRGWASTRGGVARAGQRTGLVSAASSTYRTVFSATAACKCVRKGRRLAAD